MSKIVSLVAVVVLAAATGSAYAQDYRSPDAKPVVAKQDYRSPDAKPVVVKQDFRSPDAKPTAFRSTGPSRASQGSDSFVWGYLTLGIGLAALLAFALTVVARRRHRVAIGS